MAIESVGLPFILFVCYLHGVSDGDPLSFLVMEYLQSAIVYNKFFDCLIVILRVASVGIGRLSSILIVEYLL